MESAASFLPRVVDSSLEGKLEPNTRAAVRSAGFAVWQRWTPMVQRVRLVLGLCAAVLALAKLFGFQWLGGWRARLVGVVVGWLELVLCAAYRPPCCWSLAAVSFT